MPEAPDLQVVKEYLVRCVVDRKILKAEERKPLVLRNMTGAGFSGDIAGRTINSIARARASYSYSSCLASDYLWSALC